MQKVNTSESPAEESDYKKVLNDLQTEIKSLQDYKEQFPTDPTIPLLLKIARIKLQIFKMLNK